jgi:hypothetical protein
VGEWKAPLSLRVRQQLRAGLEEAAARDKRTLGNHGDVFLQWSFEQLQAMDSTERVLRYKIRSLVRKSSNLFPVGPRHCTSRLLPHCLCPIVAR